MSDKQNMTLDKMRALCAANSELASGLPLGTAQSNEQAVEKWSRKIADAEASCAGLSPLEAVKRAATQPKE